MTTVGPITDQALAERWRRDVAVAELLAAAVEARDKLRSELREGGVVPIHPARLARAIAAVERATSL